MDGKKLTDSEIVKALDEAELFLRNRVMGGQPLKLNEYDIGMLRNISTVCAKAYDEINRLKADKEYYKKNRDKYQDNVMFLSKQCDELQAENERLEAECEEQYESAEATIRAEIASGGTSCHWCEDKVRIEAYKECIEKVKTIVNEHLDYDGEVLYDAELICTKFDNLLKELVDNNG